MSKVMDFNFLSLLWFYNTALQGSNKMAKQKHQRSSFWDLCYITRGAVGGKLFLMDAIRRNTVRDRWKHWKCGSRRVLKREIRSHKN